LIDLTSLPVAMVAIGALCPILVAATWRRLGRPDRDIGESTKRLGCSAAYRCFSHLEGNTLGGAVRSKGGVARQPGRRCNEAEAGNAMKSTRRS